MKIKWLFILAAVLIAIMLLSLFFAQVNTKILPTSEEENKVALRPPVLSEPQAASPLLSSPVQVSRAITIIKAPTQNTENKVESLAAGQAGIPETAESYVPSETSK
ncbi:MAG: hypothetical protein ABSE81_06235, partial [Candidatus Omnitrophota bacterium]